MADEIDLVEAGACADRIDEFVQRLGSAAGSHRVVVVNVDPRRRIAVALEELRGPFVLFARAGEAVDEDDRAKRFVGPRIHVAAPAQRFIGGHGPGTDGDCRQADGPRDGLPQIEVTVRLRAAPLHQVSLHFFPFFHSLSPSPSATGKRPIVDRPFAKDTSLDRCPAARFRQVANITNCLPSLPCPVAERRPPFAQQW